jgi:hypothetical protein
MLLGELDRFYFLSCRYLDWLSVPWVAGLEHSRQYLLCHMHACVMVQSAWGRFVGRLLLFLVYSCRMRIEKVDLTKCLSSPWRVKLCKLDEGGGGHSNMRRQCCAFRLR